ncbi:LysR family transcriptional regulator [Amorphus sp. MBR-141]
MRRRLLKGENTRAREHTNLLGSRIPLVSLIQTLAVAEYLNFRHAANAMGISQSSVSARVKALEEDLGILLFERHARGVRLTEAGRHFIERVTTGIDQLDHAVRTAGMVGRGEYGRLRVGIHALIPGSFLSTLIERYREQHPGIDVEIAEGTARDSVMRLRANRLDLTFVAGLPEFPDCHSRPIWCERLLAALPARHPLADGVGVTWADLADDTFIVRQGGTGPQVHDHIVMRLAGNSPKLSILLFDVERGTLLSMVAQGYGVTIAGEASTLLHAPGVTFLPILDEPEPFPFSAIWSPHNRSPALRRLLDLAGQMSRSGWSI